MILDINEVAEAKLGSDYIVLVVVVVVVLIVIVVVVVAVGRRHAFSHNCMAGWAVMQCVAPERAPVRCSSSGQAL